MLVDLANGGASGACQHTPATELPSAAFILELTHSRSGNLMIYWKEVGPDTLIGSRTDLGLEMTPGVGSAE